VNGTLSYSWLVAAAYPYVYRATGSSWEVWPAQCEPGSAVPGECPAGLAPPLSIYPNPASPQTTIEFALGTAGPVRAAVYDLSGRRVRQLCNGLREAGPLRLRWNGRDEHGRQVPAGVYFVRVTAAGTSSSARIVVLR
jgi:hypothetical protein